MANAGKANLSKTPYSLYNQHTENTESIHGWD